MKTSYLSQTAFLAATALADASNPWGLFAQVDNRVIPFTLFALPDYGWSQVALLSNQEPTEVTIEYGRIKTNTGFVGSLDNVLQHSTENTKVVPLDFTFGSDNRITEPKLYHCVGPDFSTHLVYTKESEGCTAMDVYFKQFDQNTGSEAEKDPNATPGTSAPVKGPGENNDPEKKVGQEEPNLRLTFFAKENGTYHPLHNSARVGSLFVFTYGGAVTPTDIVLQGNSAKTTVRRFRGFAGFTDGYFGFGSAQDLEQLKIKTDSEGKLQDEAFYACEEGGFTYIARVNKDPAVCSETEIYLGNFNESTKEYVRLSWSDKPDEESTRKEKLRTSKWSQYWRSNAKSA